MPRPYEEADAHQAADAHGSFRKNWTVPQVPPSTTAAGPLPLGRTTNRSAPARLTNLKAKQLRLLNGAFVGRDQRGAFGLIGGISP